MRAGTSRPRLPPNASSAASCPDAAYALGPLNARLEELNGDPMNGRTCNCARAIGRVVGRDLVPGREHDAVAGAGPGRSTSRCRIRSRPGRRATDGRWSRGWCGDSRIRSRIGTYVRSRSAHESVMPFATAGASSSGPTAAVGSSSSSRPTRPGRRHPNRSSTRRPAPRSRARVRSDFEGFASSVPDRGRFNAVRDAATAGSIATRAVHDVLARAAARRAESRDRAGRPELEPPPHDRESPLGTCAARSRSKADRRSCDTVSGCSRSDDAARDEHSDLLPRDAECVRQPRRETRRTERFTELREPRDRPTHWSLNAPLGNPRHQ